ncbi:MAG: hypothetical protein AAGA92_11170 [Planctomycetota bacterium]
MAEPQVIRFCPECSSRVQAPESVFEGPCTCPTCGKHVQFFDYPREPTPKPSIPKQTKPKTSADLLVSVSLGLAGLFGIGALVALLAGFGGVSAVLSLLGLGAAAGLVVRYAGLRQQVLRAGEMIERTERSLKLSNAKIESAAKVNQGLKQNFNVLVEEEARRLDAGLAQRIKEVEDAEAHAKELLSIAEQRTAKVKNLGERLMTEAFDNLRKGVTPVNFAERRQRLREAVEFCNKNDCFISKAREEEFASELTEFCNANRQELPDSPPTGAGRAMESTLVEDPEIAQLMKDPEAPKTLD